MQRLLDFRAGRCWLFAGTRSQRFLCSYGIRGNSGPVSYRVNVNLEKHHFDGLFTKKQHETGYFGVSLIFWQTHFRYPIAREPCVGRYSHKIFYTNIIIIYIYIYTHIVLYIYIYIVLYIYIYQLKDCPWLKVHILCEGLRKRKPSCFGGPFMVQYFSPNGIAASPFPSQAPARSSVSSSGRKRMGSLWGDSWWFLG